VERIVFLGVRQNGKLSERHKSKMRNIQRGEAYWVTRVETEGGKDPTRSDGMDPRGGKKTIGGNSIPAGGIGGMR